MLPKSCKLDEDIMSKTEISVAKQMEQSGMFDCVDCFSDECEIHERKISGIELYEKRLELLKEEEEEKYISPLTIFMEVQ